MAAMDSVLERKRSSISDHVIRIREGYLKRQIKEFGFPHLFSQDFYFPELEKEFPSAASLETLSSLESDEKLKTGFKSFENEASKKGQSDEKLENKSGNFKNEASRQSQSNRELKRGSGNFAGIENEESIRQRQRDEKLKAGLGNFGNEASRQSQRDEEQKLTSGLENHARVDKEAFRQGKSEERLKTGFGSFENEASRQGLVGNFSLDSVILPSTQKMSKGADVRSKRVHRKQNPKPLHSKRPNGTEKRSTRKTSSTTRSNRIGNRTSRRNPRTSNSAGIQNLTRKSRASNARMRPRRRERPSAKTLMRSRGSSSKQSSLNEALHDDRCDALQEATHHFPKEAMHPDYPMEDPMHPDYSMADPMHPDYSMEDPMHPDYSMEDPKHPECSEEAGSDNYYKEKPSKRKHRSRTMSDETVIQAASDPGFKDRDDSYSGLEPSSSSQMLDGSADADTEKRKLKKKAQKSRNQRGEIRGRSEDDFRGREVEGESERRNERSRVEPIRRGESKINQKDDSKEESEERNQRGGIRGSGIEDESKEESEMRNRRSRVELIGRSESKSKRKREIKDAVLSLSEDEMKLQIVLDASAISPEDAAVVVWLDAVQSDLKRRGRKRSRSTDKPRESIRRGYADKSKTSIRSGSVDKLEDPVRSGSDLQMEDEPSPRPDIHFPSFEPVKRQAGLPSDPAPYYSPNVFYKRCNLPTFYDE